ncbi:MAG: GbsR/MarR family transcriptional regulator [Bdellovibrionales bacterium]
MRKQSRRPLGLKSERRGSGSTVSSRDEKKLRELSQAVGDFIRYWGFRRIHGEIWTQVFLSRDKLSGADLTERLRVSKALISPALSELEKYGLLIVEEDGKKTKRYQAAPDVYGVIRSVLARREADLIRQAQKKWQALSETQGAPTTSNALVVPERLEEVGTMIALAQQGLEFLLGPASEWLRTAPLEPKSEGTKKRTP